MTGSLPAGFFVGEMQAPFKWILIHAARFQGMIRVLTPDGEGHVLVRKGNPMGCSFRRGKEELKGEAAYRHILSFPVVDLSIYRYTSEEMEEATHLLMEYGSLCTSSDKKPGDKPPRADHFFPQTTGEREPASVNAPGPRVLPPLPKRKLPPREAVAESTEDAAEETPVVLPSGLDLEDLAYLLLGRILRLPGVQAVSIFGRGKSVLSIGNMELDSLVVLAEDMLRAATEISTVMRTGSFVHLTLQIPSGKVIVAPYFNEYLCILTSPGVNLGQIRKILKEIPDMAEEGREVA
ncbi:MAG TPA: roadblock/LC7 domain-containing protein [Methanolinea sp.]|nr:roadblock/LC7 domain-containing protein [Methanolinea sp.]HQK54916.1 roadblock/LC7 domain-containing protein [Methanolinea sp.]